MTVKDNGKGALAEWKALSVFEVRLDSGTRVKARYLDMEQVLLSGQVNVAVLEGLETSIAAAKRRATGSKNGKDPDQAQVAEGLRYKQHVVTSHIVEVNGQPVHLELEDFYELPQRDRDQLFRYIQRKEPVPLVTA